MRELNIFVASSSELSIEHQHLASVVDALNRDMAAERNVRLVVRRYTTDVRPRVDVDVQAPIDKDVDIANCDIVIGMFWKTFGQPLPQRNNKTGTQYEIERAIEANKSNDGKPEVVICFNVAPVSLEDPNVAEEVVKIHNFLREIPGLPLRYNGPTEFLSKIRNYLAQYLREKCPVAPADVAAIEPTLPDIPVAPALNRTGPYIQEFVGREGTLGVFEDALNGLLHRAQGSIPASNAEDCRLLWLHGFGGMGKSWLIRNAAVRAMNSVASAILVDWDDPEWRQPLSFPPSSPEEMFEVIATRLSQVYGKSPLRDYWRVQGAVKRNALERRNLQLEFSAALDLIAAYGQDWNSSGECQKWEAAGDSNKAKRIFALFDLLRTEPVASAESKQERLADLKRLRAETPLYNRAFEQWVRLVSPHNAPPELVSPARQLADSLRKCLAEACKTKPLVLFLDTCELLFGELDYWLRRLLHPLIRDSDAILVIVGSRLFPNLAGTQETWINDIPRNRFRSESLGDTLLLTVEDVENLLARRGSHALLAQHSDLPMKIQRLSLGVPLAVRVIIETLEFSADSIHELDELDPYGDASLKPLSDLSQLVITKVSDRFLKHLRNRSDKERDFVDVIAIGLLVSPTLTILRNFWPGENAVSRMRELATRYSLIASGDLHLTIRDYVRRAWRLNPPAQLSGTVTRLLSAVEMALNSANEADQEALLVERANLKSWLPSISPWGGLAEALISMRAKDYNTHSFGERVLAEIPVQTGDDTAKKQALWALSQKIGDCGSSATRFLEVFQDSLPQRELALARIFAGMELGTSKFEKAFPLLESLQTCSDLSPVHLSRAALLYFAAPVVQSAGGGSKDPLRRVYNWYQNLLSPPKLNPFIFATALRELGEMERAEQVYKDQIEDAPWDDGAAHQLAHLYERTGRTAEAERYFALAAERDPRYITNWTHWANFQENNGSPAQALRTLNKCRETSALLEIHRYRLMKQTKRPPRELQVTFERAKQLAHQCEDADALNGVAWQLLVESGDLADAELFAIRATELVPEDVNTVHTLASILLVRRKWSAARPHVLTILKTCNPQQPHLKPDDIDQFVADAVRVGKGEALEMLKQQGWNEYYTAASSLLALEQNPAGALSPPDQIASGTVDRLRSAGFVQRSLAQRGPV